MYINFKNDNTIKIYDKLNLHNCQFFNPIYSLFKKYKKKYDVINLENFNIIKNINEIKQINELTSNKIVNVDLYNKHTNNTVNTDIFMKQISILDSQHIFFDNYNLKKNINPLLPNNLNYNTYSKINSINNSAYIDSFFSYIVGKLSYDNIIPNFPIYYNSLNGIGNINLDITEDFEDLKEYKSFGDNIETLYKLNIYTYKSDSDNSNDMDSDNSNDMDSDNSNDIDSDNSNDMDMDSDSDIDNDSDIIAELQNVPIQVLLLEKLDGTLEDFLKEDNFNSDIIYSCLFQVSYALHYLQKHFNFIHNDLHINNIMYKKTNKEYLYYKLNNLYFKLPTFGYIFKIIDFGRSIFKFKKNIYLNDSFSNHGEAEGQYKYPKLYNNTNKLTINYNFDLCRLATTIIDELYKFNNKQSIKKLYAMMEEMIKDEDGDLIYNCEHEPDFNLYINITKYAVNSKPYHVLNNKIYNKYKISKKKCDLIDAYKIN